MKTIICSAFLFLTFLVSVDARGQSRPNVFVSGNGRFSIEAPATPTERKILNYELANFSIYGEEINWIDADSNYIEVQYGSVAELADVDHKITNADRLKIIEEYKVALLDELHKVGTSTTERSFSSDGMPALEIRGTAGKQILARLFFTQYKFIAVSITGPKSEGFEPLAKKADTFRYLSKAEYSAAIIAEHTPKVLSQTGDNNHSLTDVGEQNLKGKVRMVVTKSQETPKSPQEIESEYFYDERGFLTKSIEYQIGFPVSISQWGWLDSERVSLEDSVSYELGEGPNEKSLTLITMTTENDPEKEVKRDVRFTSKYAYKFDGDGRLSEKTTIGNDGTIFIREAYSYRPFIRETAVYDGDGSLNSKLEDVLDQQGNITEERRYDNNNKLESTSIFKYAFDPNGNWIEQRSFEKTKTKGKTTLKPMYTTFRTISYY